MRTRDSGAYGWPGDFGALAQQVWSAFGDALRHAGKSGAPDAGQNAWQAAIDRWTQLAGGVRPRGFGDELNDVVERFAAQGRQWFGKMQEVAAQFAGRPAAADDVAQAWKQAMGAASENPFGHVLRQMAGRGHAGFDEWFSQAMPTLQAGWLGGLRREGAEWLHAPAFGLAREHQERWQAFAQAQADLQQANDAYNALMLQAGTDAFGRFERKLGERSEPGRQLQSARALFDLWIDAAEEAYAEVALSPEFRRRYADLVNAQMRVRAAVQREVELVGGLFGMPTRTEVDAAHRKIADLERKLRRLQQAQTQRPASATRAAASEAAIANTTGEARASSAPTATRRAAVERPSARRTSAASGRAASAKAASKSGAKTEPRASVAPASKPSAKPVAEPASKAATKTATKPAAAKPAAAKAKAPASKRAISAIDLRHRIPDAPEPMPAANAAKPGQAAKRTRRA